MQKTSRRDIFLDGFLLVDDMDAIIEVIGEILNFVYGNVLSVLMMVLLSDFK